MKKSLGQKTYESSALLNPKKWAKIKSKLKSRCSGHCCQNVCIAISPERLKASYLLKGRDKENRIFSSKEYWNNDFIDIDLIYPMLRFKRKQTVHEDSGDLDPGLAKKFSKGSKYYVYSCVHHDTKTGNCTIYDIRPEMCRTHGLSGCGYTGCTNKPAVLLKKTHRKEQAKEAAEKKS